MPKEERFIAPTFVQVPRRFAQLHKLFATPIALDESADTIQGVFAILRDETADRLLLDPHQSGGM